ncbi:RNA ligase RtcB family protein [Entomomonas sp. E2T0]|uniref:RNA ligase RtcB family protein n=1 Tax=Entomomonas sp. E2T0 TaxID=2930213 RepID=UPI0022281970|nr:RNA ligase RtcB family protein [Entomomonas sp. E2T0]UYZ85013.1 RNA ligase RtcB family protein [Entomomonas sp. E2T0]
MGNFIRTLSEGVSLVASDDTWIEGNAIQQLQTTAKLTGMLKVIGMPDLHPGRGYPIGAAFFSVGRFYPALVGGDIGCGMSLWQTTINAVGLNLDKLEKRLGSIDAPLENEEKQQLLDEVESLSSNAPGTIGSGNHFAELQQLETIYDEAITTSLQLDKKNLQLLVHSGSRGLGGNILRSHVERFNHNGLLENTIEATDYLTQHNQALLFAIENRELIARRILKRLRGKGHKLLDISHNLVTPVIIAGKQGWLHRKGAAPADKGLVVIPGSRGDYSYLVAPVDTEQGLLSLAHGAGRKWMRSECKGRLVNRYTAAQLTRTKLGSRVVCCDRELLYEEAPQAYKSIDTVIEAMLGAGLIKLVARFKPVLTYKTQKEDN